MKSTLINALKSAGNTILKEYGKKTAAELKESQSSIITKTDHNSENEILAIIENSFPEHSILSEEKGLIKKASDFTWVVDPLDGTSNFAAGIPWFGVLIAVFRGDNPVMAGAYLPVQDDLYFAESGKFAYKNGQQIFISKSSCKESLNSISTDYAGDEDLNLRVKNTYPKLISVSRNVRSTNSLTELMFVAEGKFGGCINFYTKIWDIAAPWLIIHEAGGRLLDIDGQELKFSVKRGDLNKNYSILGGSEDFIEKILK